MISFVILGVGMLGMAALQGTALRYSNQAYFRSQAIIIAYDIFERMRANPAGVSGGYYSAAGEEEVNCTSATCTPAQLATYDIDKWGQSISQLLPSGNGSISADGGSQYTVTINWIEQQKTRAVDEDPSDDNDRSLTITVSM